MAVSMMFQRRAVLTTPENGDIFTVNHQKASKRTLFVRRHQRETALAESGFSRKQNSHRLGAAR
jgi:hypothetical protein